VWLAVPVLLSLLAVGAWRMVGSRKPTPPRGTLTVSAMIDSLAASSRRRDWGRAVQWAERLAAADPAGSRALRNLSAAWTNYAIGERAGASLSLPALRTSLQRMAAIARALECADSAAVQARDGASLVSAHMAIGQILETEGLVCDALEHYAEVLRSAPGDKQATLRAQWVVAHLRDPQRVDRFAPPEAP
jgi:tetratricopeptide (TPR) repeat protein